MTRCESFVVSLVMVLLTGCGTSAKIPMQPFAEWSADLGAIQPVMHEGTSRLLYSEKAPGGERLVSFDTSLGEKLFIDTGSGSVREAVLSADGATVYCVVEDDAMYEVRRCGVTSASVENLFESPVVMGRLVANDDGSQLALIIGNPVGEDDPHFTTSVYVLDIATSELTKHDSPPRIYRYPVAWSGAGGVTYLTSIDGLHYDVRSWDAKSGADASLRTVDVPSTSALYVDSKIKRAAYLSAAFDPEPDFNLVVIELKSGAEIFSQNYGYVSGVKFSDKGNYVVFTEGLRDGSKSRIRVVDLRPKCGAEALGQWPRPE